MFTFTEFHKQLNERFLSIGLNPNHEKHREKHRQEMHYMIVKSYAKIGGYGGLGSGSQKESEAIHNDISDKNIIIKATKRNGKISALNFYKKSHGRKSITSATDGTEQGKSDWKKIKLEDHEQKRSWGETSGAVEHLSRKMGVPVIHPNTVQKLLGKKINPIDDEAYERDIGGHPHRKVAFGHPKISS